MPYKFVQFDEPTDYFTRHIFQGWENETFLVFDKVKDKNKIAIDLGAWIGTTAIWLSKNFYHVIAVEGDTKSLECLALNLEAAECENVTVCSQPIYSTSEKVIFGPMVKFLTNPSLKLSLSILKN